MANMRILASRAGVTSLLVYACENDLWGTDTLAESILLVFLAQCL
jgi:hypothetical protein